MAQDVFKIWDKFYDCLYVLVEIYEVLPNLLKPSSNIFKPLRISSHMKIFTRSISRSLVIIFNKFFHRFFSKLSYGVYRFKKLISWLYLNVPNVTTTWLGSDIFYRLSVKLSLKLLCYVLLLLLLELG